MSRPYPVSCPCAVRAALIFLTLFLAAGLKGQTVYTWSGGAIPTTSVGASDSLTILTGADHDFNGQNVTNAGTVNWQAGTLRSGSNAVFTNTSTGTFNDSADNHLSNPFGGGYGFTFSNQGLYFKSGTGATDIDTTFDNGGTVWISAGTFRLNGGGGNSGAGVFQTDSGATTLFNASYSLADGSVLGGAGDYTLAGGTLTIGGNLYANHLNLSGGQVAGTHVLHGLDYDWSGASLNGSGTTTIAGDGALYITGSADHTFNQRSFVNLGTVYWQDGYLRSGSNAVFTNAAGASFVDSASSHLDNPFGGGYSFTFNNDGTYRKTAAGTTEVDTPFNNTGLVDVQAGTFRFNGSGSNSGTGVFTTALGAATLFNSNFNLAAGSTLAGSGTYQLANGTLTVTGDLDAAMLQFSGGVLAGTHLLHGPLYLWDATVLSTVGTTTLASDGVLYIRTSADHVFNARNLVNLGTVNWEGGYLRSGSNATFVNAVGADFNDSASSHLDNPFGGGYGFTFTNNGTFTKTAAGTTSIDTTFDNNGTVSLLDGIFALNGGGTNSGTGQFVAQSAATVQFNASYALADGTQLLGPGSYALLGGSLAVGGHLTASQFNFTGGTLTGSHTLHGMSYTWTGTNWSTVGTTTIDTDAMLTITGSGDHTFNSRTVLNLGVVDWDDGYLRSGSNASFINGAGAYFNDAADSHIDNPFGGGYGFTFTNNGHYVKLGSGVTNIDTTFDNTGVVLVQAGGLQLNGGGGNSGTGIFDTSVGASTVFAASYNFGDGTQLFGGGTYLLSGGTLVIGGHLSATHFIFDGGAIAGTHVWHGSDFVWNATSFSTSGTTTIASDASLTIASSADHTFNSRTIVNEGVVNWNGGYLRSGSNQSFVNAAGALFVDSASSHIDNPFGGGYGFLFNNAGTYHKATSGVTDIDTTFDNSGLVQVDVGEFRLNGGGTNTGTGVFNTNAGAVTTFANSYALASGTQLLGPGEYRLIGGVMSINGDLLATRLVLAGGAVAGSHVLHGNFEWIDADLNGAGLTDIASDAALTISGPGDHTFNNRSIVNRGVVDWEGGYLRSGTNASFTNDVGAFFYDRADSHLDNPFGGGYSFTFINNGTYAKTTTGTSNIDIAFNNTGSILVSGGRLNFNAGLANANGSLILANNAIVMSTGPIALGTGTLAGSGDVIAPLVTAGGFVSPGASPGQLDIVGDLTLVGTAISLFEIGGTTQGVTYDFLNVSGTMTANGLLLVAFANGFESTITSSQSFTLISAASLAGTFTNAANGSQLLTSDGFGSFQVTYTGTGLTLSNFTPVPEPSTWALLAAGAALTVSGARRRWLRSAGPRS